MDNIIHAPIENGTTGIKDSIYYRIMEFRLKLTEEALTKTIYNFESIQDSIKKNGHVTIHFRDGSSYLLIHQQEAK